MFSINYFRTNLSRQCASNAGIRLWDALPDDITNNFYIFNTFFQKTYQVQLFALLLVMLLDYYVCLCLDFLFLIKYGV